MYILHTHLSLSLCIYTYIYIYACVYLSIYVSLSLSLSIYIYIYILTTCLVELVCGLVHACLVAAFRVSGGTTCLALLF